MGTEDLLSEIFPGIGPGAVAELLSGAKLRQLKKREVLIRKGEVTTSLPILVSGVVRGFLTDEVGRDITDCFAFQPGDLALGTNDLRHPSNISTEAMTDCQLLEIPIGAALQLLEREPAAMQLYNRLLLEALERHWKVKLLLYQCDATERYQWFLDNYPGLIDQVSNKHIASFLGMTPVTLSRLRRKLREHEDVFRGDIPPSVSPLGETE